jgi:hydrogenase expression/formation protein HypD
MMKYVDEFGNPGAARRLLGLIRSRSAPPCPPDGVLQRAYMYNVQVGLRQLLPPPVCLLTGPGCPVCVTASGDVERASEMAHLPRVIMTTSGDMMRVPHSNGSLQVAKAQGADVRMVYSTLDALSTARFNPDHQGIFLGIDFETTAPTTAAAILHTCAEGVDNLSVLSLHKLTPPATRETRNAGEVQLSRIRGTRHVTTIIGSDAWHFLPLHYGIPCAIAGFDPWTSCRLSMPWCMGSNVTRQRSAMLAPAPCAQRAIASRSE